MDISSMLEVQVKEETDVKENGKHVGVKKQQTAVTRGSLSARRIIFTSITLTYYLLTWRGFQ